jgi:hypothetical protein
MMLIYVINLPHRVICMILARDCMTCCICYSRPVSYIIGVRSFPGLLANGIAPPPAPGTEFPAFYADLAHEITALGAHQAVEFDNVRVNSGNVYDKLHGLFTAPRSGLYVFSWTILTHQATYEYTELVVNGVFYARELSDGRPHVYSADSNTVVVDLSQGDEVWIRTDAGTTHGGFVGASHCTFAGWLIHAHP